MILVTGASGFLGKQIISSLNKTEKIVTLGRQNSDFNYDLSFEIPSNLPAFTTIIHAAGKAHSVPKTETERQLFFDVNLKGTQNLLRGLENATALPKHFIFISSVSVYGVETGYLIAEDAPLLAEDPYGRSKIEAEEIIKEWCINNNIVCTILRLPLLAGPKPPGNLGAMITAMQKGYYFNIAGGKTKKSMVLAEDVAKVIPTVARIGGIYNLTDRYHPNFHELSDQIAKQLHRSNPLSVPLYIAKALAKMGDLMGNNAPINSKKLNKIISDLTFDDSKAVRAFGWNPTPVLECFQIK